MDRNVKIQNKNFKYYVLEDGKVVFNTSNIQKLKQFVKKQYKKELTQFEFI